MISSYAQVPRFYVHTEKKNCLLPVMSKAIKKLLEEARDNGYTEVDLADREIKSLTNVPILCKLLDVD